MLFVQHWMVSWLIAWAAMLPIVLLAAPAIRSFSFRLTREGRERLTRLGRDGSCSRARKNPARGEPGGVRGYWRLRCWAATP